MGKQAQCIWRGQLVMQMTEKEGEPEPVWNQAVSFFLRTRILGIACEVGLFLIFFSPEPAHVPFGIEHKHTFCFIFAIVKQHQT